MTTRQTLDRALVDVGELVARHEGARDLEDFSRFADDPVGFIRDVLGGEPWSRQVEIAEAARDHPLVVVRSANAIGKDWCAARAILWWVYARQGLALVTGPTERQVREVVMGEVARAFRQAPDLPGELFTTALRLPGDRPGGILAFTSTEASRLTGFHAPRVLAVLTEAQGVEDFGWEGVLACATGAEDRVLAVGNPLVPDGRFYRASRSGDWCSIRIPASEHPNLREDREVIPGGPSRAFVERLASEYGRESPVFRARVEAEFPEAAEDALVRPEWIDAAEDRWRTGELDGGERVELGLDPARLGPDRTVLTARRGGHVAAFTSWRGLDTMQTAGRVVREVRQMVDNGYRPERVHVDVVGLGGGVLDRLRETLPDVKYWTDYDRMKRGSPQALPFNAGAKAGEPDRFRNARSESYWHLRRLLEDGELALPPRDDLREELLATRVRFTPDGRVAIESKDDIKARIGRSPDLADALVISFAGSLGAAEKARFWFR